jgi:hypothetical protein
MTLIGNKNIFAIEWYINDSIGKWIDANLRFWANKRQIGLWNCDEPLHADVSWAKDLLSSGKYRRTVPFDHSNMSKEDVYHSIFDYTHLDACYNKYHEFYRICENRMLLEHNLYSKDRLSEEKMQESISSNENFNDDSTLIDWIHDRYVITDDITENFSKYLYLILVRDIAKNQERLVWKYFDEIDKNGSIVQEYPIEEAVLPVGYFESVVNKFVEVASHEIENVLVGQDYTPSGTIPV